MRVCFFNVPSMYNSLVVKVHYRLCNWNFSERQGAHGDMASEGIRTKTLELPNRNQKYNADKLKTDVLAKQSEI